MVIERHPSLHDLSVEKKLQLSEELCFDAAMDIRRNPALRQQVAQRLQDYRDSPESGCHGMK